ncbi:MAG: hybrid sensor histidine kinase/response regulator, partial [Nevskia sp.]|nr:hybrid sensor histidine kinase/response regulator [Nevskia sp.]
MAPEVMSRAFDPFFTTKRIGQGTGLGLSMVYGFARQSDGHVIIDSTVDVGTSVSLYLPRQTQADVDVQSRVRRVEMRPSSASETILVVDDDDGIRTLLVEILGELQYRVIEAADGNLAAAQLESGVPIDLLITDVGLPGINGREVAQIGRSAHPGLKVLMITGYGDNSLVRKQQLEPGTELMSKPFSLEALTAKVGSMLAAGHEGGRASSNVPG